MTEKSQTGGKRAIFIIAPAIMVLLVCLTFVITYRKYIPIDYNNLGGANCWLTGSMIKFVNNWFYDGVTEDRFTSYESFRSIEHPDALSRTPYLSYPPGNVMLVYLCTKATGKNHVFVSGVKRVATLLFLLEAALVSLFVYFFLGAERFQLSEAPVRRAVLGYLTAAVWSLVPVNAWYMVNTFFSDQIVLFFIVLVSLLEYLWITKKKPVIRTVELILFVCGMMTDYFFWIFLFFLFVFQLLRDILGHKGTKKTVGNALCYILPVGLSVSLFVWQLQYTDNFLAFLKERFIVRVSSLDEQGQGAMIGILNNMANSLFGGWKPLMFVFLGLWTVMIILVVVLLLKGKVKDFFADNEISLLSCVWVAAVAQILIFRNHSAQHEFSMLKVGLLFVGTILLFTMILSKIFDRKNAHTLVWFLLSLVIFGAFIRFPYGAKAFVRIRDEKWGYDVERVLYETAEFDEVYFSFTYSIPINPPTKLAMAEKEVYLIDSLNEIDELFPDLDPKARPVLLIDKEAEAKSNAILAKEKDIMDAGMVKYEDDRMILVYMNKP